MTGTEAAGKVRALTTEPLRRTASEFSVAESGSLSPGPYRLGQQWPGKFVNGLVYKDPCHEARGLRRWIRVVACIARLARAVHREHAFCRTQVTQLAVASVDRSVLLCQFRLRTQLVRDRCDMKEKLCPHKTLS